MSGASKKDRKSARTEGSMSFVSFADVAPTSSAGDGSVVAASEGPFPGIVPPGPDGLVYLGDNAMIALHIRKTLKRDTTTRIKGLRELRQSLKVAAPACLWYMRVN